MNEYSVHFLRHCAATRCHQKVSSFSQLLQLCVTLVVLLFSYLLLTMYSVRQKKVSPPVVCHFLSNHLEFLREILQVYYLFINT